MKKKYKAIIIFLVLAFLFLWVLFISNMKTIPDKRWLTVKPGMSAKEIENII
jgi:hypothetical protein